MKILLTAFEPFHGAKHNITRVVLEQIVVKDENYDIRKYVLPVSFHDAPIALQQAYRETHPDYILMMGQCGEGEAIRLERFAINRMDSPSGDNDGVCPVEQTIYPDKPLALTTSLSVRKLTDQLNSQGLSVVASNSAGLYVCNCVYYEALLMTGKALFIHIPKNFAVHTAVQTIEKIINYNNI